MSTARTRGLPGRGPRALAGSIRVLVGATALVTAFGCTDRTPPPRWPEPPPPTLATPIGQDEPAAAPTSDAPAASAADSDGPEAGSDTPDETGGAVPQRSNPEDGAVPIDDPGQDASRPG
jgi:hypothetical protein